MLCDDLEVWDGVGGKETQEGGDICIPTADSRSCTVEHCKASTLQLGNTL